MPPYPQMPPLTEPELRSFLASAAVARLSSHDHLSIDDHAPPFQGVLIDGLAELDVQDVVRKRVEVVEGAMPTEHAQRLATGLADLNEPVIVRVRPFRISSWDDSNDGFTQAALAPSDDRLTATGAEVRSRHDPDPEPPRAWPSLNELVRVSHPFPSGGRGPLAFGLSR